MDAAELRATQAPIKEKYKTDPKAAFITLKAKGSIEHAAGKISGSERLKEKGNIDKAKGELHKAAGDIQDAVKRRAGA